MPHFEGYDDVEIQPGDVNVPIDFRCNAASGSTANDGLIPYGSTLVSSTIVAHFGDDTTLVSATFVTAVALSSNTIRAYCSHSTAMAPGMWHLSIKTIASLVNSTLQMTRYFDFNRVNVGAR